MMLGRQVATGYAVFPPRSYYKSQTRRWKNPPGASDSMTRVNDSTQVKIFGDSIRLTLRNDGESTRLESRFLPNDSTRVTFFTEWFDSSHNQWLGSESFLQNLQTSDWQTQFICTQTNAFFWKWGLIFSQTHGPQ